MLYGVVGYVGDFGQYFFGEYVIWVRVVGVGFQVVFQVCYVDFEEFVYVGREDQQEIQMFY